MITVSRQFVRAAEFDSVASLEAATGMQRFGNGTAILLKGFHEPGDFGQPLDVIIEPGPDGVLSFELTDGRRANVKADGPVNVRWFGARGNGTADDSDAIEAAVGYVNSIGGGTVLFPKGVYRTTRMLELDTYVNIRLVGDGRFSTVFRPTQWAGGADFDSRSVFYFVDSDNIEVRDMSQDGSVADTAGSWLVGTRRCKGVRLVNIGSKDARAVWKDRDSERVFVNDVFQGATTIEYSSDRVVCSLIGTLQFEVRNVKGYQVDEGVDLSQCKDGVVDNVYASAIAGTDDEVVDVGGCERVEVSNVKGIGGFLSVVRLKEEAGIVDDVSIKNISGSNWTDALLLITASGSSEVMETRIKNIRVDGLTGDSSVATANLVRTTDVDGAIDDMEIRNVSGTVANRGCDIRRFRRLKIDKWRSVSTGANGMRLRVGEGCDLGDVKITANGDAIELISVDDLSTSDQTHARSTGTGGEHVFNSLNCQGLKLHGFKALGCPHDAVRIRYNDLPTIQGRKVHDFSVKGATLKDWSANNSGRRALSVEVSNIPSGQFSYGGRVEDNDFVIESPAFTSQAGIVFLSNGGDQYGNAVVKGNRAIGMTDLIGSGTAGRLAGESVVSDNTEIGPVA